MLGGFRVEAGREIREAMRDAGLADGQALVDEALSLYLWAAAARRSGRLVAAFDEATRTREVVRMASLDRVAASASARPDLRVVP
jgi:hypothetical protein